MKILLSTLCLFAGLVSPAIAAGPPAAQVGLPQQRLAALAGDWQVTQSLWPDPSAAPVTDHGQATFSMVLGGRQLAQQLHIASATPFDALGYIGFDNTAGRFHASWMDTNFTGLLLLHGDYDAARATYAFRGQMLGPGKSAEPIAVREVMHVVDAGHFTVDYFETRQGHEAHVVSLDYRRR